MSMLHEPTAGEIAQALKAKADFDNRYQNNQDFSDGYDLGKACGYSEGYDDGREEGEESINEVIADEERRESFNEGIDCAMLKLAEFLVVSGNWHEMVNTVALLRGDYHYLSEKLKELIGVDKV